MAHRLGIAAVGSVLAACASGQATGGPAADAAIADVATGVADVAVIPDAHTDDGCTLGEVTSSATADNLSLFGTPVYFAGGRSLPAGTYQVTYVDGCMKYSSGQGWTVNAYNETGCCQWWLIGSSTSDRLLEMPGTIGYAPGMGAFANFEDCVTASKASPPKQFQHPGGVLGIWLQDNPYSDNTAGENGRNPTWQLDSVGVCPVISRPPAH
jgi:hypothetical protein